MERKRKPVGCQNGRSGIVHPPGTTLRVIHPANCCAGCDAVRERFGIVEQKRYDQRVRRKARYGEPRYRKPRHGLSEKDEKEIVRLHEEEGWLVNDLCRKYGKHYSTIKRILKRG